MFINRIENMYIRKSLLLLFFFVFTNLLLAQGFVSLDWKNPSPIYEGFELIKTDMPGFAGAQYIGKEHLPNYIYTIEIGRDYASYIYEVKVEYPEFAPLSKKEVVALKKAKVRLPSYPEVRTNINVSAKSGILSASFVPLVHKDGIYQRIVSFKLAVNKKEKTSLMRVASSPDPLKKYANNSVLASGKWVKIKVEETGVYKITHTELSKMGFTNPAKVRLYGYGGRILSQDLTVFKIDDLQEIPLWREQNYVLFYGYGTIRWERDSILVGNNRYPVYKHIQNYYSTYGCYFLTEGDVEPMSFPRENSLEGTGFTTVTTFPDYALHEKEEFAWLEGGRKLFESYDYKNGNTKSYTFSNLAGITGDDGVVTVAFSAYDSSASTSVSVSVNGSTLGGNLTIGSTSSPYSKATISTKDYLWTTSKSEKAVVTLTHNRSNGISGRLDYIRLNYTRKLALYNSYTAFRSKSFDRLKFIIENANEHTQVWNIADAADFKQIEGVLSGSQYSFTYNTAKSNEFVVVDTKGNSFKKIEVVGTVANQNLHQLKDVNMVIIVPPMDEFIKQAQRLANAHEKYDGLTTAVVTSEQIYNEFSSGTPDATAYRLFMKMLYDRSEREGELKYLLLFGDASFDNRLLTPSWSKYTQNDLLLCYESVNSVSDTNSFVSDDYFGLLDDGDFPKSDDNIYSYAVDIGVGRFPVRNAIQAKEVVDKVINYMENKNAGAWKNVVAFLGDDGKGSDENVHMEQADAVAKVVARCNSSMLIKKIYWDSFKMERTATGNSYPEVKKKILELFEQGMLFFNYTGHGGPTALSDELVITSGDVDKLISPRVPFWFTAACDIAPFDRQDVSMGEKALLNPTGGAIGLMATARTVYGNPNCTMDSTFIKFLFQKDGEEKVRLGDAVRKAKAYLSTSSGNAVINNVHFVFLGDPALRLSYPEYKMVIDEFNGINVDGSTPTIKAGGKVSIKGHILNENGVVAEDFFGTVTPTVLDAEEKIITRNNNGMSKRPMEYYDRTKTLFAGSDSVRAGRFEFTFPVPLDINYSYESGLLNLYAVDKEYSREGQGIFTDFLIGGTEADALVTDSLGPKINLYLNTPEFVSGGKVNRTPYLMAEVEDEDGINAVGNGIGHDIIAIIDNSPLYTYVLNNYYKPVFGDYTKGTVRYGLPELSEGKHTLLFRVWDMKNNSSSVVLEFEVVNGLIVNFTDVTCTTSPAINQTTFVLTHDRPNTELDVTLTVYDYSGRTLWTHQESGMSSSNYYYIDWDLKTNSGQKLVPGIYLYKATIASEGSKETTQARKIVIVGQ